MIGEVGNLHSVIIIISVEKDKSVLTLLNKWTTILAKSVEEGSVDC